MSNRHLIFEVGRYHYIFFLTLLSLYSVGDGSVTVCIPVDNLLNNGQLEEYTQLITRLKEDLTSLFQDNPGISVDHLDIDFVHPAVSVKGVVDNVTVSNMDKFDLRFFKGMNVITKKLELFNLTLHNISLTGEYDIYGNIGELFDIFGQGGFWLNLINFSVSALADLPIINSTAVCLTLDINVALQEAKGWFHNLMNDDELEDLVNRAILAIVPEAVEVVWAELKETADGPLQQWIDDVIMGTSPHVLSQIVNEQKLNLKETEVLNTS